MDNHCITMNLNVSFHVSGNKVLPMSIDLINDTAKYLIENVYQYASKLTMGLNGP